MLWFLMKDTLGTWGGESNNKNDCPSEDEWGQSINQISSDTMDRLNKMPPNKRRILFLPSNNGDIPKLPVFHDDSSGADVVGQIRPGAAVVVWVDETVAAVTTIAVGSVFLSNSQGVVKSRAEVERSKIIVSHAIYLLAEQYPCKYSTKSDGCGVCYHCSTYRSLRVLGTGENVESETENKEDAREDERIQLILYNQTEAEIYLQDQCQQRGERYPHGTWQRNELRMGEALNVFTHLSSTIKNMQHCQQEGRNDSTSSISNEIEEDSAVVSYTETRSSFQQHQNATHHTILHLSLFLLRLKSGTSSHRNFKMAPTTFSHMPFFAMFQRLIHVKTTIFCKSHQLGWRRERPKRMDFQLIALVLDSFFGLIIGCFLLSHPFVIVQSITQLWKNFHSRQWNDGLEWLESFPAGFKLNVALTQQIGKFARLVLQLHQNIANFLFKTDSCFDITDATKHTYDTHILTLPTTFVRCLGLSTILFGSQFFFGFAFDLTQVALLHVRFLSSIFAACQRLELSTLISLWGLFCGKKGNVLRVRYDTLKYDHMQLLLGTILFTICLFMFTTILVYHCFFAIMNFLAELFLCGCWWLGFMVVEGIARCDFIVISSRRRQNGTEKTWIGRGMQFRPVRLFDTSYFDCLLGNVGAILDDNKKAPILRRQQLTSGQESTQKLNYHVSISSKRLLVVRATFPSSSDASIIATAFCSFIMIKTSRITTFLQSLVLGTPCPIASALVELATNSATRAPK